MKTAVEDDPYWFILSINQTITQSSTASNGEATKAVDGRVKPKPESCSLTNAATNPYLVIDFGRTVFVALLVVHINEYLIARYPHAVIKTGDSSDHTANEVFTVRTLAKFSYIVNTYGRRGRFLSIDVSSTDPEPLSICEIFAYRIPLDNIAFKKPVTMTTVPANQNVNHPAKRLVDMDWNSLALSHLMLNGWMRLDLLDSYYVAEIIYVPYAGNEMGQHYIKIGNSLENEGRSNPSCVKGRDFQLGEARSFLCGVKGRYIVLLTTLPGNRAIGGTELLVNPSHVDNIAEGAEVIVSSIAGGSGPLTAVTDYRIALGIITGDVGTGHWLRVDLRITLPVSKIVIISHLHRNNEMGDFELRVGDSLIDNGNTNPFCLSGLHSLLGKDTASFYCEPRVTGRYVNVHTETVGKSITLAQIGVYSESPPEIKEREKSRDIWHKEGSALTLSCEAYGYPTPVISWLRDGILVKNNSNTLQINQSGIYECWANNTHGRKYKPINVEITSDYRPCVKSKEILYDLGGSANAYPKKGEKFDGHKWFRFYDSSVRKYLQMVNTVPNNSSVCRGWFSGVHPYVRDGVVERSVCVKENETSCRRQFTVRIRNCFGFYVYNFPPKREADGFSYCFEKERNKDRVEPATAVMTGGMNIALSNHVFHVETEISDSAQCLLMCSLTERCQSFNFSDTGKVCELNSSTKRKHPEDLVPRNGYHYYMKGKVLLSRKLGDL